MQAMNGHKIKTLIASHAVGAGHKILGDLICEKLKEDGAFDPVHVVEEGGAVDKIYGYYIKHADFWMKIMNGISELPFFDCLDFYKNKDMYARALHILHREKPDIVIATRFTQSTMYSVAKKVLKVPTLVINAVPDFGPPLRRDFPKLNVFKPDYLMVMEKGSREKALKKFRIDEEKILLAGHETKREFRRIMKKFSTKEAARQEFLVAYELRDVLKEFDPRKKTVLIMGGSKATARALPVLRGLLKSSSEILKGAQYCLVCGTDKDLFDRMRSMKEVRTDMENVFVFPDLSPEKMALLMAGCDLPVLGSCAPVTMNELWETRCVPLIVFRHIAHEGHHVRYVRREEIGFYEPHVGRCLTRLEACLSMDSGGRDFFEDKANKLREANREGFHSLPRMLKKLYEESSFQV